MSSLWLNWRFGGWFVQVNRLSAWRYQGWGRVSHVPGRPKQGEGWVSIYEGRATAALVVLLAVVAVIWAAQ